MKTTTEKISSLNSLRWPTGYFEESDIDLPDDWLTVWSEFGVWLLADPCFGARKFAASGAHSQLIEDVAELATQRCHDGKKWLAVASRARLAALEALSSNLDQECFTAIATVYAYASAELTGKKRWALRSCAAAAATHGLGWSAFARSFSVDVVYRQAHARAVAALSSEFSRLLGLTFACNHRCVA